MKQIKIDSEFIKLDQLMKLADMVGSGGHAKSMIQDGEVKVNGKVEYQRGKKIRSNDIVEVEGMKIQVL
ncbi:S4 domain-containing protein YaaA [Tepidibacter hydrothermalis]|uniref:S4 domain-containing protein YaaA n=1 Tax=Tepidibacter hydrothermalis TaxID=3036126 RepID=A0ABY8EBW2_9FIRM|nr:S4 domain-containing protein YaaA [Tepidibacter hydrothermalis]WFD10291.1 S4 domain-containing protein YaaA [Tepidibacter hydrothermalis]